MTTIVYNSSTAEVVFSTGRIIYMGYKPTLSFTYVELTYDSVAGTGTYKPTSTGSTTALSAPQIVEVEAFLTSAEISMPNSLPAAWTWLSLEEWEPAYTIAETRKRSILQVNQEADLIRQKYAAALPPIGDLFVIKWDQIKTYLASGGSIPSYLQAELDARGLDSTHANTVANDIKDAYNTWHDATGSQIEKVRRTAILALNSAGTRSGMKTIVETAITAFEAL